MERQPPEQRTRGSRSPSSLVRGEFHAVGVDRHEREFSRDKETVDENQKNDGEKTERGCDQEILLSPFSGTAAGPRPPATMTVFEFERRAEAPGELLG